MKECQNSPTLGVFWCRYLDVLIGLHDLLDSGQGEMVDLEVLWHILDIVQLVHPERMQKLHMCMLHRRLVRCRGGRVRVLHASLLQLLLLLLLLLVMVVLLADELLLLKLHLVLVVRGGGIWVVCRPGGGLSLVGHG